MKAPQLRRRDLLALPCAALPLCAWPMGGGDAIVFDDPAVEEAIELHGGRLRLHLAPGFDAPVRALAMAWVRRSAAAVAGYFGRFPVPDALLAIVPVAGGGVRGGTTYSEPELSIRVRLGRTTSEAQLFADWVMVHEMIHLAIPRLPRASNWLHEGIATYVEGIARARAGLLPAFEVWQEWRRAMPQGLPRAGDRGLDHTPTWGRTYWGGALFCLLADVRITQASGLSTGLQQALRGVLAAGGHYGVAWPATRVLEVADRAVGQTTLAELHAALGDRPGAVDLDALWRELGVSELGLSDEAPLAAVRRSILS